MSKKQFNPRDYIPKPCKEDWNQMTGNEKRRHCEKCDTHVVDLTGLSTNEILSLREKNGGKLCGAFRLGQMSSSMVKPLVLGSGIASLALASCSNPEPVLAGVICAPPEKEVTPRSAAKPAHKPKAPKLPEIVEPDSPILLGDICIPPAKPNKEAF